MPRKQPASVSAWTDPDDAPELTQEMLDHGQLSVGGVVLRPGRPPGPYPKDLISLRVDRDVLEKLRALGPGWQTRVNEMLRKMVGS